MNPLDDQQNEILVDQEAQRDSLARQQQIALHHLNPTLSDTQTSRNDQSGFGQDIVNSPNKQSRADPLTTADDTDGVQNAYLLGDSKSGNQVTPIESRLPRNPNMTDEEMRRIQQEANNHYEASWYRYVILFSYTLATTASSFQMMVFSSVSTIIVDTYDVPDVEVSYCVMFFLISFILFNFPSIYVLENLGLKWTFKLSAAGTALGAWLRYYVTKQTGNFTYLLIAQGIVACCQPFMCNGVSKMATQWFPQDQLALATTVGSLANPLGCILGMVLAPFFVNKDHDQKDDVNDLLTAHALISTIVSVPILILYKERPDKFPSEAAKNTQNTKFNFMKDVSELIKNPNYVWITMVFASLYGVYTSLGALINPLVKPYKFDTSDCSVIGATFITSGLIGSFFFGFLLDKTQKYLLILRIVCFGTLATALFVFLTLPTEKLSIFDINIACMGFFILPIIPVGYSFSIELTFPVSEAMSNGIIMLFSQIVGTGVTYVSTKLIADSPFSGLYLFAGMIAFSCFSSLMIKEDLRRINGNQ